MTEITRVLASDSRSWTFQQEWASHRLACAAADVVPEETPVLSFPIHKPLRRAVVDAPRWVLCLLTAVAMTATALVAGHKHASSELAAAPTSDPAPAVTAPTTPAAAAARAATAPSAARKREGSVSRSASRTAPRAARVARAAQARKPHHRPRHQPRHRAPQVPVAPSNAVETVTAAKSSTYNVPGHCLQWAREQADIPSKYVDAATAWHHATGRRPADRNPPRGAAVYWTGGSRGYGHIAISLGNGKVRSSDAGGTGEVATVPIRHISAEWNLRYAGWANSINGYRIPGVRGA